MEPTRPTAAILIVAMLLLPLVVLLVARAFTPSLPALAPPPASPSVTPVAEPPEDRTPEIRGRILDAEGNPVEGAAVRIVSPSPPYTVFRDTKTDRAGTFSLAHVRDERLRVVADHDPEGVASSTELHAAEGKTLEITLVLSSASVVLGMVVDAEDHPVAGAALSVEGVPWIVRTVTSDEAGAFRLTTVPEQATSLVAVARGYKTAHVALAHREDQAETLVRVRLAAAAPVDGEVRDVDGNFLRARVVACEGQPSEARTASAEDGTFRLPPSTIGCNAVAQHDEYGPSDAASILEGHRLLLRLRPGGSLEGVVVDERGAAIPSFSVGVESFSAARGRSFRSGGPKSFEDVRGSFRLEKLAPGSYVLTASAPGRPPTRSDPIDVAGGVATKGVRIVLPQGGTVTGHVYDERHAPLAGVDLRFDSVSSIMDSSAEAKTDETGHYRLEGAPSGPFTLRVQKDGFRLRLLSGLRVDPHGTLAEDVTLTAFDGGPGLEFSGIGASLGQSREGISLRAVYAGDPAERAGLREGDRILRIDGEETSAMSVADAIQRLRGPAGTSVGVSVQRSTGEIIDVVVVRGAIVR